MINAKIIHAYKDWFSNIDDFQPEFAVGISTITRDIISGETGLRYFHNRLSKYVNKGIPKYNHVKPKIVGFTELHADNTVHYHLSVDTEILVDENNRSSHETGRKRNANFLILCLCDGMPVAISITSAHLLSI